MTAALVRKTLAIWSMVVLSGMMASCSSPIREAERAAAAAQDENVASDKQEQDAAQSYLGLIFQKLESHSVIQGLRSKAG